MTRTLDVWWDGRIVGQLTQDSHGSLGFAYGPEWLRQESAPALSVSLPGREEPFSRRGCRPFFGGLLPEESQRDAVARVLGVSRANEFALLDRLGGDVAGALQLLPPGERPTAPPPGEQPVPLDETELVRILDALPARPLLAGERGLRLSLAGAQSKVPVVLVDGAVALPLPGQPTTHILKPPIPRFPAATENEAFAMRLAAAAGLDVAPVEPRVVRARRGRSAPRAALRSAVDGLLARAFAPNGDEDREALDAGVSRHRRVEDVRRRCGPRPAAGSAPSGRNQRRRAGAGRGGCGRTDAARDRLRRPDGPRRDGRRPSGKMRAVGTEAKPMIPRPGFDGARAACKEPGPHHSPHTSPRNRSQFSPRTLRIRVSLQPRRTIAAVRPGNSPMVASLSGWRGTRGVPGISSRP